jgi:PAS domain S-box-containing protein
MSLWHSAQRFRIGFGCRIPTESPWAFGNNGKAMQIWEELSAHANEILAIMRPDFSIELKSLKWRKRLEPLISVNNMLSHDDIVHPGDKTEFELHARSAFCGKRVEPFECRLRVAGLAPSWIRWSFIKSEFGEYLLISGADITLEKKSRSYVEQIEDTAQIAGWEIDMDTYEVYWSPACYRIHELNPVEYRPSVKDGLSFFIGESAAIIKQAVDKLMTEGVSYDLKLLLKTAKGRQIWVRAISRAEKKDGRVIRCYGSVQDISAEIDRESESKKIAERFQAIANNIPIMLSLFDQNGDFVWCNPSWEKELGWDLESLLGSDVLEKIFPSPDYREDFRQFMMTSNPNWRDFLIHRRDGGSIYVSWAIVRLSDGYSVGIARNVDADYKMNQELRSALDKLRLAMEVGGLGTWEYFPKTGDVVFSDGWLRMLGLEPGKVKNRIETWEGLIHPDELQPAHAEVNRCLTGKIDLFSSVQRLRHDDGTWISVQSFGQVVERDSEGQAERFLGVTLDVTQSKVAESLLIEQNNVLEKMKERFELALRAGKFGVWDWNFKSGELVWDGLMYELFEVDPFAFKNRYSDFISFLVPEDATRLGAQLETAFRTKAKEFRSEFRIMTAKGNVKVLSALASCIYDERGSIDRLVGYNWDISEQKNSEAALAVARVEADRFFTMSMDPLCVADVRGELRRMNPAFQRILGYSDQDLRRLNCIELVHPEDREMTLQRLEQLKKGFSFNNFEHRVLAQDGRYHILSWAATIDLETGTVFGAFRDISENRENELKLLQSARMATLGEMAGGIAHEINNPLAIIHGRARQIVRSLEKGDYDKKKLIIDVTKLEIIADRIAKIVKGLRTFSRDSSGDPMNTERVRDMVRETLELALEKFKNSDIPIEVIYVDDVYVLCRSQQFGQVLLNLINNAFDAVLQLQEKWIKIKVEKAGLLARISVIDSGRGIEESIAMKMMNPFFTTKEVGKGTGLGLSISKGIAESHGGQLFYDKSQEHTTFCFELPMVDGQSNQSNPEKAS